MIKNKTNEIGQELLSNFKFYSSYSKYNQKLNRYESWDDSVDRVFDEMHQIKFKNILENNIKFKEYYEFAKQKYKEKYVLASQRSLQFGGAPILKHNAKIYNCISSYCDRVRFFQDTMYWLLCGCGVGFSVQKNHINKLPKIKKRSNRSKVHIIEDSIEGWSDAIGILLSSYFEGDVPFMKYQNCHISFDYSEIRPAGSLISGGFKAPGADGLRNTIQKIEELIEKQLDLPNFNGIVESIVAYDIVMHLSDAVLSGGVRRSATICQFSPDDEKMLMAKTGDWFIKNPQRARSNNTVLLNKNTLTREEFSKYFKYIKEFGEPGFGFTNSEDIIYNPCQPIWAKVLTKNGVKKLGEINIGDEIWSTEGWTKVLNKWSTGIKKVFKVETENGSIFNGTLNHKIIQNGKKIKVSEATHIDTFNNINDKINTSLIIKKEFVSEEEVFDISVDNNSHTYWTEGCNVSNCFEISMRPQTESGVSGSEGCNLVEINGGKCITEEIFYTACKAAAIIGTMQAAYTDFKYVDSATKEIFEREALLGCSITGFMNNPKILLNPEIQKKGAEIIKEINKEVAQMIGIRQAARTTCVKPSGNASVLLKTASGIHGEHSLQYIRNVQANINEDIAKYLYEINPKMFENSVWSSNNTDWVISFPIVVKKDSIFKDQLLGTKLLEIVKLTQENWIEYGTNVELSTDPTMRHNVSNTIIVDDWNAVEEYIFNNKKWLSGISLLPQTGDKDYNQAPFISILTPEQLVKKYGDAVIFASGLIVDGLTAFNDNLWLACDTVMGIGEKLEYSNDEVNEKIKNTSPNELWKNLGFKNGTLDKLSELQIKPEAEEYKRYLDSKLIVKTHNYALKKDWIRRAMQFSERYFSSHKEMTYCLKDVNNYHKWIEINRDIKDIDWSKLNVKPNYLDINTTSAVACSGNSCEITF